MSKLIQNYQGSNEDFLYQFVKVEVIKGMYVVQVLSWAVRNFSSFKSCQYYPNEYERRGLEKKKKNILSSIFDHFDLMLWWKYNVREGSYVYPFEEETDYSKIPLVLSGKISQLKINSEKNMPGCTKEIR